MPTSRSGTAHHAKVEGRRVGRLPDDLTLLACHALHRAQRVVVWPGLPQQLGIPLWGRFYVCGAPGRAPAGAVPRPSPEGLPLPHPATTCRLRTATTDDKPPSNHEQHDRRLEYFLTNVLSTQDGRRQLGVMLNELSPRPPCSRPTSRRGRRSPRGCWKGLPRAWPPPAPPCVRRSVLGRRPHRYSSIPCRASPRRGARPRVRRSGP
jgi:hypothetical protein